MEEWANIPEFLPLTASPLDQPPFTWIRDDQLPQDLFSPANENGWYSFLAHVFSNGGRLQSYIQGVAKIINSKYSADDRLNMQKNIILAARSYPLIFEYFAHFKEVSSYTLNPQRKKDYRYNDRIDTYASWVYKNRKREEVLRWEGLADLLPAGLTESDANRMVAALPGKGSTNRFFRLKRAVS